MIAKRLRTAGQDLYLIEIVLQVGTRLVLE